VTGRDAAIQVDVSHATETHTTTTTGFLSLRSLALHLFRDLYVDFEELGDAAVEADGFALVQVGFAVAGWDAFL